MIKHENDLRIDFMEKSVFRASILTYIWIFVISNYPEYFYKLEGLEIKIKPFEDLCKNSKFRISKKGTQGEHYVIEVNEYFLKVNKDNYYEYINREINKSIIDCISYINKGNKSLKPFNKISELNKHCTENKRVLKYSKHKYSLNTSSLKLKYRYRCSECKTSYYKDKKEKVYKCLKCNNKLYYTNRLKVIEKK